jgi:UDP-glucose 4-epimerase
MIKDLKEVINNSLKEILENTTEQVKKLNKNSSGSNMEIETTKKSQREKPLEMENLGKRSGDTNASINNKIQRTEKRILGIEDTIEDSDTIVKENTKCKKILTQNIQEIQNIIERQKTKTKTNKTKQNKTNKE